MFEATLFEKSYVDLHKTNGFRYSVVNNINPTFNLGMEESVHRWFRLTPSYSPELIRHLLSYLDCDETTLLLDPFLGKGTTLIECKKKNVPSIGIEINPLLFEISKRSVRWEFDINKLIKLKDKVLQNLKSEIARCFQLKCEGYCNSKNISIPKIYNPFRWWQNKVLKDLLIVRTILRNSVPVDFQDPFWIAMSEVCLNCANIHRNHPTISFDDNHSRKILVLDEYTRKIEQIIEDLSKVNEIKQHSNPHIFLGDSVVDLRKIIHDRIDRVITSPPYPNRFSYIHTTRPQLYFMELLNDIKTATEIDMRTVGGTWGRATSVLEKQEVKPYEEIDEILDFREELLHKSKLMCNYATKYFNDMYTHFINLKKITSEQFRGAYVVGNSKLKTVEVYTELYLAKILRKIGFKVDEIMFFRKRGGKKKLYESAVIISN
ncbi:site-specific DNA-methyltransferase [bacterium]|nr:site-specific DNA-methyltransferase [bacterium]